MFSKQQRKKTEKYNELKITTRKELFICLCSLYIQVFMLCMCVKMYQKKNTKDYLQKNGLEIKTQSICFLLNINLFTIATASINS